MGRASNLTSTRREEERDAPTVGPIVALACKSDPFAIRDALRRLRDALALKGLDEESAATAEVVLAEVLNNIGKHAYAGEARGVIEMAVWRCEDGMLCRVCDGGAEMPGGHPPSGQPAPLDRALAEGLPEGGFGWPLIRALASQILYCRDGNRNRLSFKLSPACLIDRGRAAQGERP